MNNTTTVALTSDIYIPSIDENGNYVDGKMPTSAQFSSGIKCSCCSRETVFFKRANFMSHLNSKCHKNWLEYLTNDKNNLFYKNSEMKKIIEEQKILIKNLKKQVNNLEKNIVYLTNEIRLKKEEKTEPSRDLIELNLLDT